MDLPASFLGPGGIRPDSTAQRVSISLASCRRARGRANDCWRLGQRACGAARAREVPEGRGQYFMFDLSKDPAA